MSQHTPGPWIHNLGGGIHAVPSGLVIVHEKSFSDNGNERENRLLCAAAPDLLAAVKGLYPHCHDNAMLGESDFERAWLKVEAAVSRAEGR